ncbi:unnamed protein product [Psylliodes chrysocephalus]|uniref:Uncharacterized protein n=1 Tax=Psylliodes chrysocephalus TaxID=3402493 RepID=A0A9P0D2H1_9CUCU|nr:unnamed protein product [Psylliodes chrysocephala]
MCNSNIDQIKNTNNESQTEPNDILQDRNKNKKMYNDVDIELIKMPKIYKKKGRPKESDLTSIGIKKRRKIKVVAFSNLSIKKKQEKILSWILREEEAAYYVIQNGDKVEDCHIENNPEKVSNVVLDPNVDLSFLD